MYTYTYTVASLYPLEICSRTLNIKTRGRTSSSLKILRAEFSQPPRVPPSLGSSLHPFSPLWVPPSAGSALCGFRPPPVPPSVGSALRWFCLPLMGNWNRPSSVGTNRDYKGNENYHTLYCCKLFYLYQKLLHVWLYCFIPNSRGRLGRCPEEPYFAVEEIKLQIQCAWFGS